MQVDFSSPITFGKLDSFLVLCSQLVDRDAALLEGFVDALEDVVRLGRRRVARGELRFARLLARKDALDEAFLHRLDFLRGLTVATVVIPLPCHRLLLSKKETARLDLGAVSKVEPSGYRVRASQPRVRRRALLLVQIF